MENILSLIGRTKPLFVDDLLELETELKFLCKNGRFLVLGGAGSIGQAVTKEIFKRSPKALHVVDISENNMVELVRDLRSSYGYKAKEFKTFCMDIGSLEFESYFSQQETFDYVLNLSALKHVRSEKDPFTLMRLINVNIVNTVKTIELSIANGVKKYFCVSTDKASNPVNMMGASKRIMEFYLARYQKDIEISTARFANVAFSDGSLPHGFNQRMMKKQPIVAPKDVKRYFVTPEESGLLCLLSTLFGKAGEVFFPKLSDELHLITFAEVAKNFLEQRGLQVREYETEDEARKSFENGIGENEWPCLFTVSDTTGEKGFEEFFTESENVDFERFPSLGIIVNTEQRSEDELSNFLDKIESLQKEGIWTKKEIVNEFMNLLPGFSHLETGKYLDDKM